MRNISLVLAGLLLGSLACEGPPPVPTKPTWVDDVEPILRGSCFHCHGSLNPEPMGLTLQRWDFYEVTDGRLTAILDLTPTMADKAKWPNAKDHTVQWLSYVTGAVAMTASRMPPPPAAPLSDSAIQTIRNWGATNTDRGTRPVNKRPAAAWLVRPSTIVVSDDDHEQVLGKITCGGADEPVLHSGTTKLPTGWQPPCTATLFDGQDVVTVNLQ